MIRHLKEETKPGRILIWEAKHGKRYFLAEKPEQLFAIALSILKQRLDPKYGRIQKPGKPDEYYNAAHLLADEQIQALPAENLREVALYARGNARAGKKDYDREVEEYAAAKRAVKEKNGEAAWDILDNRSTYEYEGYEFEYLEEP